MDKTTAPLIEGIDSQTMQGGSYIRQPDGAIARVAGPNLSDAEKAAAPELIKAHDEAMAAAVAKAEQAKTPEAPAAVSGESPVRPARRGASE